MQTEIKFSKNTILLLAFIEGFVVLICEILGKNLIAPFFGNSLSIWTIILGNTFLFLSLGYYIGGRMNKEKSSFRLKKAITFLAFYLLALDFLINLISPFFLGLSVQVGATLLHLLVFAPLFITFGTFPVLLVNIYDEQVKNQQKLGNISAKVFFTSTLGGMLASLIVSLSFYLNIEIRNVFFISSLALITILYQVFRDINLKTSITILLGCILFIFLQEKLTYKLSPSTVYHSSNLYGDLKVYDQFDSTDGFLKRMISVNNIPQSSIVKSFDVFSTWNYVHRISVIASLKQGKNALLFGMGGGSIASELQKLNMNVEVVDIDERMFEIADKHYFFQKKKLKKNLKDARYFLNTNKRNVDLMVFDILNGESQPNNLFTIEGVQKMKNSLKNDGIIIIEFQEIIADDAIAYKSIANTFLSQNFNVYISQYGDEGLIDFLIIASPKKIDFSQINFQNCTPNVKSLNWIRAYFASPAYKVVAYYSEAKIFADNQPILDKLSEKTRNIWRKNFMK